jgi:hypothetical protein
MNKRFCCIRLRYASAEGVTGFDVVFNTPINNDTDHEPIYRRFVAGADPQEALAVALQDFSAEFTQVH